MRISCRTFAVMVAVGVLTAPGFASAQQQGDDVGQQQDEQLDDMVGPGTGELQPAESADEEQLDEAHEQAGEDEQQAGGDQQERVALRDPISPVINEEGSLGFHGIASVISPGPMQFQTGLFASATGGSDMIRYNDDHGSWAGSVLVNASFNDYFGAYFATRASNTVNTFGRPQAMLSQGDTNLGAVGRYEIDDGITVGGDLGLFIPSQFGGVGVSLPSMSVRPRLLASFDIDGIMGQPDDLYVPVIAHANFGYRFDGSENLVPQDTELDRLERLAFGVSAYDEIEFGLGAEFPLPYVTPFLGWNLGIPVNPTGDVCEEGRPLNCVSEIGGAAYPQRLSLGAKGEPIDNLGLHLGMDIGLTAAQAEGLPATLPYEFQFGVSWNIDPTGGVEATEPAIEETEVEVEPERGILEGLVIDEETQQPVGDARIRYAGLEVNEQLTDADSGAFESYEFEPGEELTLEIDHPDYVSATLEWTVEDGIEEREIGLERLTREVLLSGTVVDETEEPLQEANVIITPDGADPIEVQTDEDGEFSEDVTAGEVTVAAVKDGYLGTGEFTELDGGPDGIHTVLQLSEVDELLAEVDNGEISLGGNIDFEPEEASLQAESDEVLDHLAALLLANPDVGPVEIQGHTADDGDDDELVDFSQQRAAAVKDALVERGVPAGWLQPEGYGAEQPLVPNTSDRNRQMNRRVEFHLLD